MANEEHLAILKQGVKAWNRWRKESLGVYPDLSGAILSGTNLVEADLVEADLSGGDLGGANLSEANLSEANLYMADLHQANLSGAILRGANLNEADLYKAILRGANLNGAILIGANLSEADLFKAILIKANLFKAILIEADLRRANLGGAEFAECVIGFTPFDDVDLSTTKGLATVQHGGPSTIGIDTIYKSKGKIPEVFLRGAGVPANLIEYIPSLVGQAIQYYSCFISHSHSDQCFCDRLYADLQAKGVRVWYFPENVTWGRSVWGEIDRSIKLYDKLVVVCSEHSLQSGPVCREIERSLQREDREGKEILFPVRLDNYLFDVWDHQRKADVLAKVVGDFRGWDRGTKRYAAAFDRLMKGLQGKPATSGK